MSEPNSLDLMYEALTGPSRSIYKENPGLVSAHDHVSRAHDG